MKARSAEQSVYHIYVFPENTGTRQVDFYPVERSIVKTENPKKTEHILWIDGLRGIACFLIFAHHLALHFYPSVYYGELETPHLPHRIDVRLATSPLGVIINGNFFLCVFLLISAYLTASGIMRYERADLPRGVFQAFIKRWPRLMFPALATGLLNYVTVSLLYRTGLSGVAPTQSLPELLLHSILIQWFTMDSSVLGPFWMLHLLLLGSWAIMLLSIPAALLKKRRAVLWVAYVLFLIPAARISHYFFCMQLGLILAYGHAFGKQPASGPRTRLAGGFCIAAGLFLGGYPSFAIPHNGYRIFDFLLYNIDEAYQLIHSTGALLLVYGLFLIYSRKKDGILTARPFQWLGKRSYSVFLVHVIVINTFSYLLSEKLLACGVGYLTSVIITVPLTVALVLLLSALFYRFAEQPCAKLTAKLVALLTKRRPSEAG